MPQIELLKRIDDELKARGLSERKALLNASLNVDFIRDIRRRGHSPKVDKLAALAKVLGKPLHYFTEAIAPETATAGPMGLQAITVRGAIQAGVWQVAAEWDETDHFAVTVPASTKYPGIPAFGLLVRGTSMDRLYPDGTIVIVVRFGDLARMPLPGERVVVVRRSRRTGEFEATLKEYERDLLGRHVLWPRSSDPEFQTPFVLTNDELLLSDGDFTLPGTASAGNLPHDAGQADVYVDALVIGSYRPE